MEAQTARAEEARLRCRGDLYDEVVIQQKAFDLMVKKEDENAARLLIEYPKLLLPAPEGKQGSRCETPAPKMDADGVLED